jgi:uncharacterized protein YaaN involved in tellurite resistance
MVKRKVAIMIAQKLLKNVEYFNYLGSIMAIDSKCTRKIKSRFATTKPALKNRRVIATMLTLVLRKKLLNYYIWSIVLYSAESWKIRSR